MEWLENLGLLGLFIGTFLAATVIPFSSDAVYLSVLAATGNPAGCLIVGTLGNFHLFHRMGRQMGVDRKVVQGKARDSGPTEKENRPVRRMAGAHLLGTDSR